MTVFLHIGLIKTGTTSIQTAMHEHAARLRRQRSVYYPTFRLNHWPVALLFVDPETFRPMRNYLWRGLGTVEDVRRYTRRFVREFDRKALRYDTQVLSAEQFEQMPAAAVEKFAGFFRQRGLAPKVIVYVRHPAERLSSLMSQRLRGGHDSLATFKPEDDVTPTLRAYAAAFGKENIIIRRFGETYFTGGDLLTDFMAAIGQAPLAGVTTPRLNASVSLPAVLLADRLFETAPLSSGRRGSDQYFHDIPGPKFLAPRPLVDEVMELYRPCLAYLQAEFGVEFDPVDLSRFPPTIDREMPPAAWASIAGLLNEQRLTIDRLTPKRGMLQRGIASLRRRAKAMLARTGLSRGEAGQTLPSGLPRS